MEAKEFRFESAKEAEGGILAIDVSDECAKIMAPKAVFMVLRLTRVRNAVANIIKQEMLSDGGDATVSQYTVNCAREKTDVLIMGTLRQVRGLANKMRVQGYYLGEKRQEYEEIADALDGAVKKRM
jgi:dihydropteroate synthase